MSKTICIIILSLVCAVASSYGQSMDSISRPIIASAILDHSDIQRYIESHRAIIKRKPFQEGFRIQIYNGSNRDDANRIKSDFYSKFPYMRCYISYQQPYYKVRVGDYEDQTEAKPDLKKMAKFYPSSFLVPDQIRRTNEKDKN